MTRTLALAAAVALSVMGTAQAQGIDPVLTRQAAMGLLSGTFGQVRAVVAAKGDVKTLESAGKNIARFGALIPSLFPPGSDKGTHKATPAVWSDAPGFMRASMTLSAAGGSLERAAKSGDLAAVEVAAKSIGDACGACHNGFRAK